MVSYSFKTFVLIIITKIFHNVTKFTGNKSEKESENKNEDNLDEIK